MPAVADLDALEAKHAAATPGEWAASAQGMHAIVTTPFGSIIAETYSATTPIEDALAIAATHNALPALIAELRLARSELHVSRRNTRESERAIENANRGLQESSAQIAALKEERDRYRHEAEVELAERKRIAEASRLGLIAANDKALEHMEARMRDEAELRALRAARDAAEAYLEIQGGLGEELAYDRLTTALAKVPR